MTGGGERWLRETDDDKSSSLNGQEKDTVLMDMDSIFSNLKSKDIELSNSKVVGDKVINSGTVNKSKTTLWVSDKGVAKMGVLQTDFMGQRMGHMNEDEVLNLEEDRKRKKGKLVVD